jgi:hypothetical protein
MRVLRNSGREMFRNWVLQLADNPSDSPPIHLLSDEETSFGIPDSSELAPNIYTTKYDMAAALLPHVEEIEALEVSHECWPGIWDAMALHFFESICIRNADGQWQPRRIERYVYDPAYTVRHRHLVYGPVTLYRTGRAELGPFFKVTKPHILSDFEEQVGSRNELAGNPVALQVIKTLYVENDGDKIIPGYTNRTKFPGFKRKLPAPGTLRRFTAINDQLKRTYDLAGISYEGFLELLPDEFTKWLDA